MVSIVFEGATDDAHETTLTVADPTADRTITFPNESGNVHTSGGDTTHTNIIIADAGTIGSASDVDAITIAANGQLTLTQTLIGTALDISGNVDIDGTTNLDIVDIDGAVNIAAGVTIAGTNKIVFNDASQFIQGSSATVLDLAATDEIELTATLVDVVGNFTNSGTLVSTGVVTANAGVVVDEMTLDADTITATDDFIIDAVGEISLDADNSGIIYLKDAGTIYGQFFQSSTDFYIQSQTSDKDMIFRGNDGGSVFTALTLDMSEAGAATFNSTVTANAGVVVDEMTLDGDTLTATDTFTIDAVDDITLNSDNSGRILFGDASVIYGIASNSSSDFVLEVGTNDKDMLFKGQDNGSTITALTLDMSEAGAATFNGNVTVGGDLDVTGSFDMSDANITNVGSISLDSISGDGDTDTSITFSGSNVITVANGGTGQVTFNDGSISPVTDSDVDLGTTSLRFKDVYVDSITATDQITATGFTGTLDGILGSGSAAAATVTTLDTSGAVNLNLVTDSTSSTSGALIVDGGVGVAKKLFVGTDLDVDGTANLDIVDIDGAVDMATTLQVDGVATFTGRDIHSGGITIANDGQIGSVGDADSIAISSTGVVTFSQSPVFPDGSIAIADLDIDGGTDIGADLTTSDLIVVDDGAGGANRKAALSRMITLVVANIDDPTALAIALG